MSLVVPMDQVIAVAAGVIAALAGVWLVRRRRVEAGWRLPPDPAEPIGVPEPRRPSPLGGSAAIALREPTDDLRNSRG